MEIYSIKDMDDLKLRSDFNKRKNYADKISAYFSGTLSKKDKKINWAKAARDYDLIPWAEGVSYEELWKQIHKENKYYKERAVKEPVALEIIVGFNRVLDIDMDKWGRIQYDWFSRQFGEENLISAMVHLESEENPHCHFIIYHTDKAGKLTVSPYLIDEKPNLDFLQQYEKDMSKFGLDKLTQEKRAKQAKANPENETESFFLNTISEYVSQNPRTELDDHEYIYDARGKMANLSSAIPFEKQEEYLDELLDYFNRIEKRAVRKAQTGEMEKDAFFDLVRVQLAKLGIEKSSQINTMLERIDSAIFGNYVLDPLLNDDSISDIKVISPSKIRVKRYGRRFTSNLTFRDIDDYWRFLRGIATRNHTDLSPFNAVQNFTDKISNKNFILRFNICTNFVNSVPYPYLHIRKINKDKYSIEDLIRFGMMDMKTAAYLIDKVKNGRGMLFTGKGASGKTTIMNTLLDYISFNASGLVIQENEELFTKTHPDLMFQHIVTARHRGEVEYDLKDLARNGLLTDLDYFVIGEIKGGEALYFLNAAYTGHKCLASCHGASATQAMNKLADYVKYESDYSREDCLKMLQAMEVVVFMKSFKVAEIAEIVGWNEEKHDIKYRVVYRCNS